MKVVRDGSSVKVTLTPLAATTSAVEAGRRALTPELLAATGARYSRNNEGLPTILARIPEGNPDASVDSIFRMLDYGHQSIADMAPVALFIDQISIWMAYYIWSICPTASGQESSTRYIKLSEDGLIASDVLGIDASQSQAWSRQLGELFKAYREALEVWEGVADLPDETRIPRSLYEDTSDKGRKQLARMKRNFAFDRARVFLPACAATNLMLVMSARGWAQLTRHLASLNLVEANRLAELIREELKLIIPRLVRHSFADDGLRRGLESEFQRSAEQARNESAPHLADGTLTPDCPVVTDMDIITPSNVSASDIVEGLRYHENRYGWVGPAIRRTMVRFSWNAVALAEIRDLNRHRTGSKFSSCVPVGFYTAEDQFPILADSNLAQRLTQLREVGRTASRNARERLAAGDSAFVYWLALGTQLPFEHSTTADKFIYEAELRTGLGAHYRYAQHLRDALAMWYRRFPSTRGLIIEGAAEPE